MLQVAIEAEATVDPYLGHATDALRRGEKVLKNLSPEGGKVLKTDTVLPGVTVEASSPALIEKVRTAVTDGQGQYRIVDVRPGTYTVTFTLPGFTTVKREGIELPTNFTATVNAELGVGDVTETITVTGASPVVDVQNTTQQARIPATLLASVPSAGGIGAYVTMTPGLWIPARAQDVGGSVGEQRVLGGS